MERKKEARVLQRQKQGQIERHVCVCMSERERAREKGEKKNERKKGRKK